MSMNWWFDGLIIGSPARLGHRAAQMSRFLDPTGPLRQTGALVGRPCGFFTGAPTSMAATSRPSSPWPPLRHTTAWSSFPSVTASMNSGPPGCSADRTAPRTDRRPTDPKPGCPTARCRSLLPTSTTLRRSLRSSQRNDAPRRRCSTFTRPKSLGCTGRGYQFLVVAHRAGRRWEFDDVHDEVSAANARHCQGTTRERRHVLETSVIHRAGAQHERRL